MIEYIKSKRQNYTTFKKYKETRQEKKSLFSLIVIGGISCSLLYIASEDNYLSIKALHIISVICWMASILYLPRIFVYHCDSEKGSIQSETFKIMEHRLLRYISNPAMILTWSSGLWMAWNVYHFHGGWLHLKLGFVFLLSIFHGFLIHATHQFTNDENQLSEKTWRIFNEVPTLLMIATIIVVVLKIPT